MRRLNLLPGGGPVTLTYRTTVSLCLAYTELDGTKSPKWITLHAMEQRPGDDSPRGVPPAKPARLCGIYKLDGDKLVLCLPEAEISPLLRPTDFKGDGEGGLYVLTYKRAAKQWTAETAPQPPLAAPAFADSGTVLPGPVSPTPAVGVPDQPVPTYPTATLPPPVADSPATVPPPTAPANALGPVPVTLDFGMPVSGTPTVSPSDLDRLQGVWLHSQQDGKGIAADANPESGSLEILHDRLLTPDGKHGRVRLDESKSPKRIVFELPGKDTLSGIYKLEGDRWTIAAHNKSTKLVPIAFEPDAESGISVTVLERAKEVRPPALESEVGVRRGMTLPSRPMPVATQGPPEAPGDSRDVLDLRKEVDQLREQIKRLEKLLKDRPLEERLAPGVRD
jgi:uncharacterized protein (TIGR03067 family)